MFLNSIQPAEDAIHVCRCVGRGIGSGSGKTGGRGYKGQKSRSDGFHKVSFEGSQMPLQRRLLRRGFKSLTAAANAEIRLSELGLLAVNRIDVLVLKRAGLIPVTVSSVKVIASGELSKAIVLKGIKATKGAEVAIGTVGGKVEE